MTLNELKSALIQHQEKPFKLLLPAGDEVPVAFHITEVGHVVKKFIDCGGRLHSAETCQLQTWVGKDEDHRLQAGKLTEILEKALTAVLPANAGDLPVEIEYEDCVISQYPVTDYKIADGSVVLHLAQKHTDCLAKDVCIAPPSAGTRAGSCCGGKC